MLTLFRWLDHTGLSAAIRTSKWGFAIIEMIHLIGLAILGGTMLVLVLRALDVVMTEEPLARIAKGLIRPLLAGLLVMVSSGALLVADGPLRYYANAAFRIKMALLAGAIGCGIPLHRALRRASGSLPVGPWLKTAVVLSALLWLAVSLAGRLIGVL